MKILLPKNKILLATNKILIYLNSYIFFRFYMFRKLILFFRYRKLIKAIKLYLYNVKRFKITERELRMIAVSNYKFINLKERLYFKKYILDLRYISEYYDKKKKSQNRNELCSCNSGKKFKNCCLLKY